MDESSRASDTAPSLASGQAPVSTPELLDAFFDTAIDLLCIADLSGRFLRLNGEWTRTLGYPLEELVGRTFLDLVHPDDQASTLDAVAELASGQTVAGFVNRYRCRDGSYRWIEWRSAPLGVGLIAAAARDVTATRRAEEQLRESESALRRTQMLVRLGHWRLDVGSRTFHCSDEIVRIFGLPEAVLPVDAFMGWVQPADRERVRETFARAVRDAAAWDIEFGLLSPDGTNRHLRSIGQPVVGEDGRVESVLGTAQDLTERYREEEERRRFEAQIQQVQKLESLGVLAGGIAHDFNNMLMAIAGNAELALEEIPTGSPARSMLDAIVEVCGRASDLSRQMLAYSGRGRFVVQSLDFSRLIADTRKILQVSVSKRADLRYRLARGLPAVEADSAQVRQVLVNLVTNASEALGDSDGTITVTTEEVRADRTFLDSIGTPRLPEGRYVVLTVEDDGGGMDQGTRERIFEPFFTTKFTGRGLGLAAVHGIVQSHKGAISVWSEPGRGSRFTLLFPAHGETAVEGAPAPVAGPPRWRGQGLVLLADDEEAVRTVGRRLLERLGFDVITARDGREAVELFREKRDVVRCVLLDLTMPKLGGEGALREIRLLSEAVPVVLCSGYTEQEVTRLAGLAVSGFVEKPYRMNVLSDVLEKVLGGQAGEGASGK